MTTMLDHLQDRDVIFVSNALANGGAARVISLLANRFDSQGRKVGILSFLPYQSEYVVASSVSKIYAPPGDSLFARLRRLHWIRCNAKRNPKAVIVAFEYFVNLQTLVACAGLRNPVFVSERNDPVRVGSHFPIDLLRKLLYRMAATLICQTEDAMNYFPEAINKRVIMNPLDSALSGPLKLGRRKCIVTFGRLEPQKNLELLIRAFKEFHDRHQDYTLEIYGDGSEREALIALVDVLSLAGIVRVFPARPDIHDVARACSMFVLSSDYEGLSNSMIEAMALGLPTVCTDCPCGGARMVIRDGDNGLLVPVGDMDAMVAAMSMIADDEAFALRIGQSAAKLRDRLSLDRIAAEWEQILWAQGGDSL